MPPTNHCLLLPGLFNRRHLSSMDKPKARLPWLPDKSTLTSGLWRLGFQREVTTTVESTSIAQAQSVTRMLMVENYSSFLLPG